MARSYGDTQIDPDGLPKKNGLSGLVKELRKALGHKDAEGNGKGGTGTATPAAAASSLLGSDEEEPLVTLKHWLKEKDENDRWPKEVEDARNSFHPRYREAIIDPCLRILSDSTIAGLEECLGRDPVPKEAQRQMRLITDIAGAMIQQVKAAQGKPSDAKMEILDATLAFREVVMDLYDGFMDAEDRAGIKPPENRAFPPQVLWDKQGYDRTPHTWTVEDTRAFGLRTGVVSLPMSCCDKGLLAWAMLAHETAGHDILVADEGLREELRDAVARALHERGFNDDIVYYWSSRIDEAASDVLSILNMGPAAGIGLIGYLKALAVAESSTDDVGKLKTEGELYDAYPVEVLRGYLAAATVGLLSFHGAGIWADRLIELTRADQGDEEIKVGGEILGDKGRAEMSARIVSEALVRSCVPSLENHCLGDIQDWRQQDEQIVEGLRACLNGEKEGFPDLYWPDGRERKIYAAHVVAAAVTQAVFGDGPPLGNILKWLRQALLKLQAERRSWDRSYPKKPAEVRPENVSPAKRSRRRSPAPQRV